MKKLLWLLSIVVLASCTPRDEVYVVSNPIKSLQFERLGIIQGDGHFFLGCGNVIIGEEIKEYYYFYELTPNGYQLRRSDRTTTYLLECDTIDPCVRRILKGKKITRKDESEVFGIGGILTDWISLDKIENMDWEQLEYIFDGTNNYTQLILPEETIINYYNTYE